VIIEQNRSKSPGPVRAVNDFMTPNLEIPFIATLNLETSFFAAVVTLTYVCAVLLLGQLL
jgi:hypothetical protein